MNFYDIKYDNKGVIEVKKELKLDIVKLGSLPEASEEMKNVPSLIQMLANTSDLFSPPEKVYGRGPVYYSYYITLEIMFI